MLNLIPPETAWEELQGKERQVAITNFIAADRFNIPVHNDYATSNRAWALQTPTLRQIHL